VALDVATGPVRWGEGGWGNGLYFTEGDNGLNDARKWAGPEAAGRKPVVVEAVLPDDMVMVTAGELATELAEARRFAADLPGPRGESLRLILQDPGNFAVMRGYQAVEPRPGDRREAATIAAGGNPGFTDPEVLVLDRSALTFARRAVRDADAPKTTGPGIPLSDDEQARLRGIATKALVRDGDGDGLVGDGTPQERPVPDYGGPHRPAPGPPAWDLLGEDVTGEKFAPDDIYDHPDWYVGDPGSKAARETITALRRIRGNPDAKVTIYRSTPGDRINPGDWVSLSRTYAAESGYDAADPSKDLPVVAVEVPARDVRWAGDDLNEFGYWGPTVAAP
jgi:hypothetical protein